MEVVSADSSGEGMHVKHVGRRCDKANGDDVMEAIEQLMNEGLLYSTIDDLVSSWWASDSQLTSARRGGDLMLRGGPCVIEAVRKRVYDVGMSCAQERGGQCLGMANF